MHKNKHDVMMKEIRMYRITDVFINVTCFGLLCQLNTCVFLTGTVIVIRQNIKPRFQNRHFSCKKGATQCLTLSFPKLVSC